jgi:hypothetical protein
MALLDELSDDDTPLPTPAPPAETQNPDVLVQNVTQSMAAATVAAAAETKEEEEEEPTGGFKMTQGKKSKKQLLKEKKEAEAKKRFEEAKESMKDWDDPKVAEDQRLAMQLAPLSLKVKDIPPDGHCLYRAIADQCVQNVGDLDPELAREVKTWEQGAGHTQVRAVCAAFMRQNVDDFAPFVDTDDFGAYIDKIQNSAEWGGDVELTALARRLCSLCIGWLVSLHCFEIGGLSRTHAVAFAATSAAACLPDADEVRSRHLLQLTKEGGGRLGSHIHVYSAAMSEQTFSPDKPSNVHLRLSYHKHAFGLGEHYNSVVSA